MSDPPAGPLRPGRHAGRASAGFRESAQIDQAQRRAGLRAPTGHGRRDRGRAAAWCRPGSSSTPRSGVAATPGRCSRPIPASALIGLDQDDEALAAASCRSSTTSGRAPCSCQARFDRLADVVDDPRGRRPGHRRALRPRRELPAARPGRPGLQLPPGCAARHADGPARADATAADIVNDLPRGRARRRCCAATVTSATPSASPAPSSPPVPCARRPSWPSSCVTRSRRRRAGAAAIRPSARSRRIRIEVNRELDDPARAPSTTPSTCSPPAGGSPCSPTTPARTASSRTRLREAETGGCTCPPGLPCVCGAESQGAAARARWVDSGRGRAGGQPASRERAAASRRCASLPSTGRRSEPTT